MFKKRKKVENCKRCNKPIADKEETYHDLCFECYKEYLLEMIEKMDEEKTDETIEEPNDPQSILDYIKNLFHK